MWLISLCVAASFAAEPIAPAQAIDAALARIPAVSANVEARQTATGRPVWAVHLEQPAPGQWIAPIVHVDAASGAVLRIEESAIDAGPLAHVYPNNPLVDGAPIEVELPGTEGGLLDDRMELFQCRDFGDSSLATDEDGAVYALHVCTETRALGPRAGTDYIYPPNPYPYDPGRDEDHFAPSQVYWNLHRSLAWFDDLGWVSPPEYDPHMDVVVNRRVTDMLSVQTATDPDGELLPYNNAYHQGGWLDFEGTWQSPRLVFGQGSDIDYAYDADVIHHELGHMIVGTSGGPSYNPAGHYGPRVEANALNEGIADYFSGAIQGDALLGEYAGFDRDAIRRLDGVTSCVGDLYGESHYDSQPFSQGLWAVRATLGPADQRLLDQALLQSLPVMGRNATFADAFEVITAAVDATLGNAVGGALRDEWRARSLDNCAPVLDVVSSDEPFRTFTQVPAHYPFNERSKVPGYMQFRVDVTEPGSTVRIWATQYEFLGLDLYGTNQPKDVRVFGRFGDILTWTTDLVEEEVTFSGYNFTMELTDWKTDGSALGQLERVATREYEPAPERNLLHDYALEFTAPETGTLVFQFVNEEERSVYLADVGVTVTPPLGPPDQVVAPSACGCASHGQSAPLWLAPLLLAWVRRRP